jgi:hypothetical protein
MLFEHWGEFYLLAGSAAAVLIGLIFVVVTLMQDWSRSRVIDGSKLYMGPIVLQVSFVLVLSAAALSPHITGAQYALVAAIVGLWGLARGVYSSLGIRALAASDDPPHWSDLWCYGVVPAVIDVGLLLVAYGFWRGEEWAEYGVAAVITALLLISIRNEWDLVTWLAPHPDRGEKR